LSSLDEGSSKRREREKTVVWGNRTQEIISRARKKKDTLFRHMGEDAINASGARKRIEKEENDRLYYRL